MRGFLALLAATLLWGTAHAQGVIQGGSVTSGHVSIWATDGVVSDGGPALAGFVSEIGITNTGTPFCINDGLTSGPYHQLCLGSIGSAGVLTWNAYGGASPLPLEVIANGATYPFPGTIPTLIPDGTVLGNNTGGTFAPQPLTDPRVTSITVGQGCPVNTNGSTCVEAFGANAYQVTFNNSDPSYMLRPTGPTTSNIIDGQVTAYGRRSDIPAGNEVFPVYQFYGRSPDAAGFDADWCGYWISAASTGTGVGPIGDQGQMTFGCRQDGQLLGSFQITGNTIQFLAPFQAATPIQPPTAGDGETHGYVPLEEAATNSLLHSNAFCAAPWTDTTLTCGSAVELSPDGTADMVTITSTSAGGLAVQTVTTTADVANYTGSAYFSDSPNATATVWGLSATFSGGGNYSCLYTPSTAAMVSNGGATCAIQRGNVNSDSHTNWRLSLTGVNSLATSVNFRVLANGIGGATASAIVFGAQFEKGASPTSHIPTAAGTVARVAGKINPALIPYGLMGYPTSTLAGLPSAATATGQIYQVTDVGVGGTQCLFSSDGTSWAPTSPCTIAEDNTSHSITAPATPAETNLASVTIKAGLMCLNCRLKATEHVTFTGSTNAKDWKLRLGTASGITGTAYISGTTSTGSNVSAFFGTEIVAMNSTSSQSAAPPALDGTFGIATGAPTTSAVDMTAAAVLNWTAFPHTTGEVVTMTDYRVVLER